MKQTNIAVLVSGGGTNLQALIDAQNRGELGGGEIVAVISSKHGAYALERAAKAGIEGYVLPRKEFASNQAMTIALVKMLKISSLTLRWASHRSNYIIYHVYLPQAGSSGLWLFVLTFSVEIDLKLVYDVN